MNILLTYDCVYPESLGGVEYRNHCLAQALAERGHTVTIAGWVTRPHEACPGVTIKPLAYRSPIHDGTGTRSTMASLKFAAAIARLDVRGFDTVETANIPYIHLPLLALRCRLAGRPLIVTWYEYFGPYWREYKGVALAGVFRGIEWACAQVGRVNATSPLTAARLQAARIRSKTVPVIPCGVWLRDIQIALQSPAADVPELLYAGRLIPEKRVDLLIQALALLDGPVRLGIVGAGPDRERLETLAASLGIAGRVVFYGRIPDIADVWRLLAGCRIAVQPSSREGFGLFPLEAIALGRPLVTCESANSAVGAIVRDGVEGLCTEANPPELSAGLSRLLTDDALWASMSAAALARAANYDWPRIAEEIEAFMAPPANDRSSVSTSGPWRSST